MGSEQNIVNWLRTEQRSARPTAGKLVTKAATERNRACDTAVQHWQIIQQKQRFVVVPMPQSA
jgi:hypothetical protein